MPHVFLIIALLGSALGVTFSAVSTYDFVAHLDRQVHGLHCSFLPGMTAPDASGASGCHLTLMSPYSSLLRESIWGGIPIALPALALFAFLLFWGAFLALAGRARDPNATGFYAALSIVPVLASVVMATISLRELGAFCKLCIGIYVASGLTATGAIGSYLRARRELAAEPALSIGALAIASAVAFLFVGSSTLAYALAAPDFSRFAGSCGALSPGGDAQALISLGDANGAAGAPALLEVLDPLCPACRAFERRFEHMMSGRTTRRSVLLFPLDNKCNWMVDRAIHPGACAVSEALLCAGDASAQVLAWAFDQQEELVQAETAHPGSAQQRVLAQFPALNGCVGSSKARARLNRALRWAVDHRLPVLTPQLYVDGKRLCDADTDLGLDYMLGKLLSTKGAR